MASGIEKSGEKIVFAKDLFKDRIVRGSFENDEYYSQMNVLVRDPHRKDRGIRNYFKEHGYKAPNLEDDGQTDSEKQHNIGNSTINVQQARTKGEGGER